MKKEDSRVLVILFSNELCLLLLCDAADPGADINTLQLAVTLNKEDPVASVQLVSSDLLEDLVIFYLCHYF